ncbi:MAG TPA: YHS domain-containing protein [Gemmatimonadales bacterium]|jgi:Cu+-exporting ATPase
MAQVLDPVCGMSIDPAAAEGVSNWNGERYYFCSKNCQHQFDADPAHYAKGRTEGSSDEPPFTKTGPVVAPKFGAAGSGGAEYEPGPPKKSR